MSAERPSSADGVRAGKIVRQKSTAGDLAGHDIGEVGGGGAANGTGNAMPEREKHERATLDENDLMYAAQHAVADFAKSHTEHRKHKGKSHAHHKSHHHTHAEVRAARAAGSHGKRKSKHKKHHHPRKNGVLSHEQRTLLMKR